MDFHSLTRRELQTLCKKNKIPANITNVAMADALEALDIVEGVEEFMHSSQSETAQSSIESLASLELTSSYVPPTAGRSTRRRTVTKGDLETVNSMIRTQHSTRRTVVKVADESQADVIETPALVAQTNKKKGQMTSVCRKMDSQLKECVVEDKKDVLITPAPLGVTSRRRRVEETEVKKVYGTRRSVRLAEKNVEMMNEVKNEESNIVDNELLIKDIEHEDMNLKEGLDEFNEVSGITGADATTAMEETCENNDESEIVSAQKEDIPISEFKLGSTAEEETCSNVATEAQPDEQCDNTEYLCGGNSVMPQNVSNEVQHSNGSSVFCTSEVEIIVKNSEELNTETDTESQDKADFVENVTLESKDNFAVDEFSCNTGFFNETEQEFYIDEDKESEDVPDFNVTLAKFTELSLQQALKEMSPGKILGDVAEADSDFIDHLAIPEQLNRNDLQEIEILQHEESKEAADIVPSDEEEAAVDNALASVNNSPNKQLGGIEGAENGASRSTSLDINAEFPEHIPTSGRNNEPSHPPGFAGLGSHLVKPTCLTPSKSSASKAATTMKRMTVFSDNKENIGSGSKLVVIKDRAKLAKNTVENVTDLAELSVRRLTKMLKEKLEITKKLRKTEHANEALRRPALRALPENNQLVDETQN